MTKKDFYLIADVLKNAGFLTSEQRYRLAQAFAVQLAHQHPSFNPEWFHARVVGEPIPRHRK